VTDSVALATLTSTPKPADAQEAAIAPTAVPTVSSTAMPALTSSPAAVSQISLRPIATGFTEPTFLTHAGDKRIFVVERQGQIQILAGDQPSGEPFLDFRDRVGSSSSEQGLLSLAFHPNYAQNGLFYVNYTNLGGNTIVSSFRVSTDNPDRAEADSEEKLLQINQPFANHNGGQILFGPDGYLYIGMGDGGSQGDPQNNGQNGRTLLGALLRLDVDGGTPYAIPGDNPFEATSGQAEEIWATGLRNPWRISFDRQTGDLYLTDVGQNDWEEVNFQPAIWVGGTNYGWNILEGNHCYRASTCDGEGLELPVAEYSHAGGNCSIIGGYVYRGQSFPKLRGNYFFADICSGTFWSLFRQSNGAWQQMPVLQSDVIISSFGEDLAGELYALDLVSGTIYQLTSP
jgi:glucose/arabinose dehydrogenase